ncbi:MAG TPA: carboxypeptidase-like regulatory domain-containing protein, partial [Candidatus Thermoplasmatota archaeon]|nr:carboxypeptidase-like regulatory domain-containing protein [Candidatus Thermoplasmatota archaeon]
MRGAVAVLFLCALLAGCSGGPSVPAEVLIESKPPEEVRSNDTVAAVFTPSPKTRGHIAGVVVDEAIRPIQGARVVLPGLDLTRTTDRDGSFGFVDLHPGPYFITVNATGYFDAEAVLHVGEDEFTRAKVVLTAMPPPMPYRVLQSFDGYTDLTADPLFGFSLFCNACDFDFYVDRPALAGVIVEAVFDGASTTAGFYYRLYQEN